jgi:hypothetical protein
MPVNLEARRSRRAAGFVVAAAIAVLVAAGLVALVVSVASYAQVKHRLDAFASDHDAAFSRHRFAVLTWELRALAGVLLVAAAATYGARSRLLDMLERLLGSVARSAELAARGVVARLHSESRIHLGALAAIVLVGLLVRLDFLFQPMRYDESGTYVHYASRPLYIGLSAYTAPNNHLFHTLLVHLSTALFGSAPWAVRLPAFAAGVLLVPATYLAARAVYDRHAALLAAGLVAASSELVEYSTNARGYTLLALDFALLLALASWLARSPEPAGWLAFAVLAAFGMWTVPTMLYGLAVVVVWLVATMLSERRHAHLLATRLVPSLVGAAALTLLLYAPAIVSSGPHALLANDFVRPRGLRSTADALPRSLWDTFSLWNRNLPLALELLLALGFVVAVVRHRRVSRFGIAPALAVVVVVPIVLAQRVVPYERVWLVLLPLYLITASAGIVSLAVFVARRRRPEVVAVVAVAAAVALGLGEVTSRAVYHSEDTSTFRAAAPVVRFLAPRLGPRTRILAAPPADLILEYYLDARGLDGGRLLYDNFRASRLFVVVKQGTGKDSYPLAQVIDWRPGSHPRGSRPVLLRRFRGATLYELVPRR